MRGLRGVAAGVLTLVALQVLGSGQGPQRGGQLLVWVAGGLQRLISPDVPGVPRRKPAPASKAPARNDNDVSGELPRNPISGGRGPLIQA